MSNITEKQLMQYNDKIKSYIQQQLNTYIQQHVIDINNLNLVIQKQSSYIKNLENIIKEITNILSENNIIKDFIDINTEDSVSNIKSGSLRSISPSSIEVQEDIQEDYVVYDRIISPNENKEYKNIVVTTDDKSNRVFFSMWKTFDNRDLEDKQISVIWINPDGFRGESLCGDKRIIGDRLYFSWDIPGTATPRAGVIRYAIRITAEEYAWHTLPAEIMCVQGLMDADWEDIEEAKEKISWVDWLESQYKVLINIISEDDYNNLDVKDDILYVVKMNDHTVNLYLADKYINTLRWNDVEGVL